MGIVKDSEIGSLEIACFFCVQGVHEGHQRWKATSGESLNMAIQTDLKQKILVVINPLGGSVFHPNPPWDGGSVHTVRPIEQGIHSQGYLGKENTTA